MAYIVPVQRATDELAYEGLAAELPPVEPTEADLVAIEAGCDLAVQDRLEYLDTQEAALQVTSRVDELAVRRTRRRRAQILAASITRRPAIAGGAA